MRNVGTATRRVVGRIAKNRYMGLFQMVEGEE